MDDLKQRLLRARLEKARSDNTAMRQKAEAEKPSQLEAAARGTVQGLTMGGSDEIVGVAEGLWDAATTDKPFMEAYRENRDESRQNNELSQAAHPGTYKTTEIGAGVASSFIPGLGVLNAAKGAKLGATAGKAALSGGIAGFGLSDADVTKGEVAEAAADTLKGAGAGLATGALGHGLSKSLSPNTYRNIAERRAFKAATGNQGKFYDEAVNKGRVNEIGRELLDSDAVTFGSTARDISKNADRGRQDAWSKMSSIMDEVDTQNPGAVDGAALGKGIREYAESIKGPNSDTLYNNLLGQAEKFEAMGKVPMSEAQRLKGLYKWDPREQAAMPLGKAATNKINALLTSEMEDAVGRYSRGAELPTEQFAESISTGTGRSPVVPFPGKPGAFLKEATAADGDRAAAITEFLEQKGRYGNLAQASKSAEKLANRQEKNRSISLSDMLMGGFGGVATGNPLTGIAVGAVNNQLRKRGSSAIAVTADKVADVLDKAPEMLGPYASILKEAAAKGNKALGVTHFMLMKNDPAYMEAYLRTQPREEQ